MTPQDFIEQLQFSAISCQEKEGIPAAFTLAQGALESGWGKSRLFREAKNIFGVKADKSWEGERYALPTREFIKGAWTTVDAEWRKYATYEECFVDHAQFFKRNPRYAGALRYKGDSIQFAFEVAKAGYATDPDYARKLITLMTQNNLLKFGICG